MASLAELVTPKTSDQITTDLLTELSIAGFPVTAWQPGSVPRTLVRAFAVVLAALWTLIASVAKAAFLDTAEGAWLTLHAKGRFNLDRIAATFAQHSLTLVCASGAGPHTITPGQLVVTTTAGLQFRSTNTSNVIVAAGMPQAITVRCERAGIAGNTAPAVLVTPASAGLSFTWGSLSLRAREEETDIELRVRCRAKWAVLARGATRDYYKFLLLNATLNDGVTNAGVTRVGWLAPLGDGTFTAIVAGADGPLSPTQLSAVQTYVSDLTRRAYTDGPIVQNALAVTVTPAATIYVRAAYNTAENRAKAVTALNALAASLEIGQSLDLGAVYAAIYKADGILNVALTAPTGDTVATSTDVVTINITNINNAANWQSS